MNRLICDQRFEGEIDLLSIDIDGNDYWIWEAIECVTPRVVVVEYNSLVERAVTIPYRDDFVADMTLDGPNYLGATLSAFAKLGQRKGYRLVGGERAGFNAFFVRDGIGEKALPCVPVSSVAYKPSTAALELFAREEFIDV